MGLHNPNLPLDALDVAILGVPYDGSVSHKAGAAQAPDALRKASRGVRPHTEAGLNLAGLRLRDLGDVPVVPDDEAATQMAITQAVRPVVEAGAVPFVLGGDHSITHGVVAAFHDRPRLGILWLDSHPDVMDRYKGPQGRRESPWNHACPLRRICELPHVRPQDVLVVGLREFIPEELHYLRTEGIEVIPARELARLSPEALADRIGRKFAPVPEVYVSVDVDVLDPAHAPGTGVPVPGGISSRYLYNLFLALSDREQEHCQAGGHFLQVVGFDVVEVAPPLDVRDLTILAAMGIATAMLGYLSIQRGVEPLDL